MNKEIAWLLREKYRNEKSEGFFTDCTRLEAGEPLAYVIGWVPFLNTKIWLDLPAQAGSHPLIPRTETEYWVEKAITHISSADVRVLDLCAGSGAIGVAVAKALPQARVDFAEIDARHHATIEKNIRENGITISRARVFGGNLFEKIAGPYDVILTNPPYIDPSVDRAEKSVKIHEPHLALYGGKGGTEIIKEILKDARKHLTPNGLMYIEHEPEQAEEILRISSALGYSSCNAHADQFGIIRYTVITR